VDGVCRQQDPWLDLFETFWPFVTPEEALIAKWSRIRAIRDVANKEIEAVRVAGQVGASLQATLEITAGADDAALLRSLGDDLKFVTITSGGRPWPTATS
jgi:isoleucyl-tRNA synthetase